MSQLTCAAKEVFKFGRFASDTQKYFVPTVSVICINKNHAKYLETNFLSVLSQDLDDFEFLVADGGSTDSSLEIISQYSFIQLLPGKDTSRNDGILRAVAAARGRYVMITTSTDGYLSRNWFRSAATELDNHPAISLVYGASATMSEDGSLGNIVYPKVNNFYKQIPSKKWAETWLLRGISKAYLPELNYCVRRDVIQRLIGKSMEFPQLDDIDPILRFHFQFNRLGYSPKYLPILANFGRSHENSQQLTDTHYQFVKIYKDAWRTFQKGVIFGIYEFKQNEYASAVVSDYINSWVRVKLILFYYFINPIVDSYLTFKHKLRYLIDGWVKR